MIALVTLPGVAAAAALDNQLGFGSLPSAQGWTYAASGAHAGVLESSNFSVSGGVLAQNCMGQSNGVSGGFPWRPAGSGSATAPVAQMPTGGSRITGSCKARRPR